MKQINTYINEKLRLSAKPQYTCQPKSRIELQKIIIARIKDDGPNCDLNDIDVSKITDMRNLFDVDMDEIFKTFNGDVSMWDVSNVTNMNSMFWKCKKFNCDISKWNVHSVKNIGWIFYGCVDFNCDLSRWNISNVKNMNFAFYVCPTKPAWYDKDKWG